MRFANAPLTNPAIGSAAARRLPAAAAARALGRPAPAAAVAGTATAALAAARRPRAARGRPAAAPRRRTLSLALEALRARALAVLVLVLVLVAILVLAGLVLEVLDLAVVALLVIGVVVLVDELAVLDHAAPRAGLELLHLDERLEAMQVGTHRALDVPHPAGGLLEQPAGVHVDVQLDPRQTRGELMERHDARVRDALGHLPLDPLVRALRLDVGLEFLLLAPDLGRERDGAVVLLRDPRDPVHKLRPVLELGPLVVRRLDRHGHVHGLLHRHPPAFSNSWHTALSAAAVTAARQQAARGVLHQAAGAAGLIDFLADAFLQLPAHLVAHLLGGLGGGLSRHLSGLRGGKVDSVATDGVEALLGQRRKGCDAGAC